MVLRWAPLGFAAIADVGVDQDSVQPGADVAVRPKGVKPGECFCQRVLDQVFGIGVMAGHPQRLPV